MSATRERHYVLGHIAMRLVCAQDPHYFFGVMASPDKNEFLSRIIRQVEQNCPDDPDEIDPDDIIVLASRLNEKPMLLIQLPAPKAYCECRYVGIVSMMDMARVDDFPHPDIEYFTLELGEGDSGDTYFFCQWHKEEHTNLAETEALDSIEDFATLIKHRLEPH